MGDVRADNVLNIEWRYQDAILNLDGKPTAAKHLQYIPENVQTVVLCFVFSQLYNQPLWS